MAKFNYDENSAWREKENDDDEPWKKAHEEWKAHREAEDQVASDKPFWNENQWERFIQHTDKEGLKVIGYYEKFWSHSDRDRMVEQAMAMYYVREAFRQWDPLNFKRLYHEEFLEKETAAMGVGEEGAQGFLDAKEHSLYQIPAYRYARDFHNQIRNWVSTIPETWQEEKIVENLSGNASQSYTKLAAGHVMGYQPATIGGNISLVKRSLSAMNRCMEILYVLKNHEWFDRQKFLFLDEIALETRNAVALRVQDLRDRSVSGVS